MSEAVVIEMAQAMRQQAQVSLALAVSGIAGPGGGSAQKPVGTVCFAWAWPQGNVTSATVHFSGSRAQVRTQTVQHALRVVYEAVHGV